MNNKKLSNTIQPKGTETSLPKDDIRRQLKRILSSPNFDATKQQRAFLNFIVSQTVAGNSREIKGYNVATKVFGRDENFDQSIDPIVSIQANKLRRSLERYYLLSGKDDAVHIDIPKGTYVPVFREQNVGAARKASRRNIDQDNGSEDSWPTVLIKPFQNLTNDPEKNHWGTGFATELATEITRCQWINVLQYGSVVTGRRSSDIGTRFVIEGSFRGINDTYKVVVVLVDTRSNKQIWSDTQWFDADLDQVITFQEQVAAAVGAIIAGEQGIITRILSVESRLKIPGRLKTYEAILQFHVYDQTLTPENFLKALEALENARINEPDCGQAWSFLARLHADIFSLEIPGFNISDAEQKALEYAEKGASLNPDNQSARSILALVRMFAGNIGTASRDIHMAYKMNPDSISQMDGIGYLKTLLGDWKLGPKLINTAIKYNPYYKTSVHYALWVNCLRQKDLQGAYLETTELRKPAFFWYPLAKAATLGLLGRIDEGNKFAQDLLALKPEFQERGRVLIRRYVKFDDIADLVIEGLDKVGINID